MFTCYLLLALVWSSTLSLSLAYLEPVGQKQSAEIGGVGYVVYEIHQNNRPDTICHLINYNCTTPRGPCKDHPDKYELEIVDDPNSEDPKAPWFCGIRIADVSIDDVGEYNLWQLLGVWHPVQQVNFALWENIHGRICQTSYDEISNELVNNCTSLTTHPPSTTERLTTEEKETTTFTQETLEPDLRIKGDGTRSNDALNDAKRKDDGVCHSNTDMILTGVLTFIGTALIFLVVPWAIRWVREKRRRDRFDDFEGYRCGVKMDSRPYVNNGDAVHHEDDVGAEPPA